MKDLAVVIPVYNEEEAIGAVLDKWVAELDKLGIDYTVNPYNDGSKDGSWSVIQAKEKMYPGRVVGHDKANSGHGPTILQGYRDAADAGFEWIFQVDSDDEMGPEGFADLWNNRDRYDFLVGTRDGRKQALPRKIISAVSRLSVRLFYGRSIWDVNTPYRLMRASAFHDVYRKIPSDTFAPNVILSGMAAKLKLRCFETRVPQHDRTTGEVSIKKWKLLKAAMRSFFQAVFFAMDQKPGILSVFLLSALIAALFVIQLSSFREMISGNCYSDTDSSVFLTIAREMLHGRLPYRDFFDHKGLYIYFVDILGLLTHLALLEWLFFTISAWILYRILLLTVRPRLALLLMFLWPFLLLRHSILGYGNQVETFVLPAIAYAIYYPVALIKRDGKVPPGMTFLLGISFGWILMLKFNYISTFAASGAILLWMLCKNKDWKGLCISILIGLAGTAIAILPGILYLWKQDILSDFADVYIRFNLNYADSHMTSSRLLRLFRCWERNDMPNNITRLIILFPWLAAFVLFVKKEHCDKGDKAIAVFILATLLLNAPGTWLGARIFSYYFFTLTLIALLAYALIMKYALRLADHLLSKTDGKILFTRPATVCFGIIAIVLLFAFGSLSILNGIRCTRHIPGVQVLTKDPVLCELLEKNDARMLVITNDCFLYRFYNARPDCRYLYQSPAEVNPAVWDTLLEEIRSKKTPLILISSKHERSHADSLSTKFRERLPEFFADYLFSNYDQIETYHGTLFVCAPEKQMQ